MYSFQLRGSIHLQSVSFLFIVRGCNSEHYYMEREKTVYRVINQSSLHTCSCMRPDLARGKKNYGKENLMYNSRIKYAIGLFPF